MSEDERVGAAFRAFDRPAGPGAPTGRVVLVAARAGTGKTALVVQAGIDALLRGLPVLHVTVGETLAHAKHWYDQVYRELTAGRPEDEVRAAWESLEARRLLLAFRRSAFDVARLTDRVRMLESLGVLAPRMMALDGLALGPDLASDLGALNRLAAERDLDLWVAGRTPHDTDDVERVVGPVAELCETVVVLEPQSGGVAVRVLRGAAGSRPPLRLDPGTLLLKT